MNFHGIILGVLSFLIIGIWHPLVIKGEYHFGKKICIPVFASVGIICLILSLLTPHTIVSVALALFGFSAFWGIKEVQDQEKRVERGWFPKKEKKHGKGA